jgi:hypothetical protein
VAGTKEVLAARIEEFYVEIEKARKAAEAEEARQAATEREQQEAERNEFYLGDVEQQGRPAGLR